MRKILIIINVFLALVFFSSSAKAEEEKIFFSDTTSIRNDIKNMGLDYTDYPVINNKDYNLPYTIAGAEGYLEGGLLDLYIYIYNPYVVEDSLTNASIVINNEVVNTTIERISSDSVVNVVKYAARKITKYGNTNNGFNRGYTIKKLYRLNDYSKIFYDNFSFDINQFNGQIKLQYDSFIVITGMELIDYLFDTDNSWTGYWQWVKGNWGKNTTRPQFFFLNFDTNKPMDKILEIDVTYEIYKGRTEKKFMGMFSDMNVPIYEKYNNTIQRYDINKPKTIYSDTNHSYKFDSLWEKFEGKIPVITTPAKTRLTTGEMSYYLSDNKFDSGLTTKESFTKRQHSILIDVKECDYNSSWIGFIHYIEKWAIEDCSVTRIKYQTENKIFNARTSSGAPINSNNGNENSDSLIDNFFDKFKQFFNEKWAQFCTWFGSNFKQILLWIFVVVILFIVLPLMLLKFGFKMVLRSVLFAIKLPFIIAWWAIKLPFKILFSKEDKKENKKGKKRW